MSDVQTGTDSFVRVIVYSDIWHFLGIWLRSTFLMCSNSECGNGVSVYVCGSVYNGKKICVQNYNCIYPWSTSTD